MKQYIDKSEVVREIEKRINKNNKKAASYPSGSEHDYLYRIEEEVYEDLLSFLNTLEVKEVDLEKYYHDFLQKEWFDGNHARTVSGMMFFTAKHFYELGLKAQKGE